MNVIESIVYSSCKAFFMRPLKRNLILVLIPRTDVHLWNSYVTFWDFVHSCEQSSEPSHIFWMYPASVVLSELALGEPVAWTLKSQRTPPMDSQPRPRASESLTSAQKQIPKFAVLWTYPLSSYKYFIWPIYIEYLACVRGYSHEHNRQHFSLSQSFQSCRLTSLDPRLNWQICQLS